MNSLGYRKNVYEQCVFNKSDKHGVQCTAAVHVDDLLITSVNKDMIESLCDGLKRRYGEITRTDGPMLNYLGIRFDLTFPGETRITMQGYVEDILALSNIPGMARTSATDGLFEICSDAVPVNEERRMEFHSLVAKLERQT